MNKTDLIEAVATEMKIPKGDAAKIVESVLGCIETGLKSDAKVNLTGFGTFIKKNRPARTGVSPITKQPIDIPPTVSCGFRPSAQLKERL